MSAIRITFTDLPDLASTRVGGKVLSASDEFFAPKENLLLPSVPIFVPDRYTEFGKWMDGWETRRRRAPGYDWCVLQLGIPGVIRGVNIDTAYFTGNYPEYAALDGLAWPEGTHTAPAPDTPQWKELIPKSPLAGGTANYFSVQSPERWTHLRLRIYPDGGIARLRVYGEPRPDWKRLIKSAEPIDLAAIENGGCVVTCNDAFFGPKDNLILPGRASNMGEGWETRRRRRPGNDWIIVRLGAPGKIKRIEIDTHHFKGNFPESASLEGTWLNFPATPDTFTDAPVAWEEILPRAALRADTRHFFESEIKSHAKCNYVRLSIYPDGGVSRLRLWGVPEWDHAAA